MQHLSDAALAKRFEALRAIQMRDERRNERGRDQRYFKLFYIIREEMRRRVQSLRDDLAPMHVGRGWR